MLEFHNIQFITDEHTIKIANIGNIKNVNSGFAEIQIAGENKNTHLGSKMIRSSEGNRLKYVSHTIDCDSLTVVQQSPLIQVDTIFTTYSDTNAIRVKTTVKNISDAPIVIEELSALCIAGFGDKNDADNMYLTRFLQSHHAECQPRTQSFRELGLCGGKSESQQRASGCNIGSWSTKEAIPMGIIEDRKHSAFMMFQIESNNCWYYEVSDVFDQYYLYLSGPNYPFGCWYQTLTPGESCCSPYVSIAFGDTLNDVIGNMTRYRRHIAGFCPADKHLPTIFNEYMHLSWDSPTAENTAKYAPIVAKTGVEYYVIDCGWHNEEDGDKVYPFVGHWKESSTRFPEGVKKTTDFIRSLGMKPGLWIEPEIIGKDCQDMLSYYDDECFLQRHGRRLTVMNRHFLDYRNPKVRNYMSETIRRMIEDYGAEYIKCDYNQDCGVGTDLNAENAALGLRDASEAFYSWIEEMMKRYPNVVFEGCASGGMRMDYDTLSKYSLISTSDQTDYLLYPYIAGNILAAVLPEQAAVWSYPVASDCKNGDTVTDERIIINMINSFLGRMHLASHLDYLNDHQLSLIQEGINYYNSLSEFKKKALPYFPFGFTEFGKEYVAAGLIHDKKLCLAVWNLKNIRALHIPFQNRIADAVIAYPSRTTTFLCCNDRGLDIIFPSAQSAVFIEITFE